jgi:tetratricopeptide (TPR) repeat protein
VEIERALKSRPEDERLHSSLGIVYAALGRNRDAAREGERGVEMLPVEKEAWRGTYRLMDLAQIYTMIGEHEKAIDIIERLLSIPAEFSATYARMDPKWKPLHGNNRFEELVRAK